MDYDGLRYFSHLARTLHYGRASRECAISPSALSRAIQRLEAEVGCELFERDSRSVSLTPQGERFATFASDALARWQQVREELRREDETLAGELSLFASVTACQSFLPGLLARFREAHPQIHLRLETGYAADALETLERGEVDLTVAALPERIPRSLVTRIVVHTPLVLVAPTAPCDVQRRVDQSPIDWAGLPFVLPAFGLARRAIDRWLRGRHLRPEVYGEVTGHEAILSLVSTGCGVGVVPQLVIDQSPLSGAVRALDVQPGVGEFRVGVCTRRTSLHNPLVAAFWEVMTRSGEPQGPGAR